MIRDFKKSDMDQILNIWLESSIEAHDFIEKEFWESRLGDMKKVYIPLAETYVYEEKGSIRGFISLSGDTLAALFVSPLWQGKGIGKHLVTKAKTVRNALQLTVYKENSKAIEFYKKCGFEIIKEQIDDHTGHKEFIMGLYYSKPYINQ